MPRPKSLSTAAELRRIATDLLRISNDVEAQINSDQQAYFKQVGKSRANLFFAKRDSLLEEVHATYRERRRRKKFLPPDLFGEPAWDILLDLFASRLEGRIISVSSACIAADVPATTGLRWLKQLEDTGFVDRKVSDTDQRVTWVQLSDFGVQSMEAYFYTRPVFQNDFGAGKLEPLTLANRSDQDNEKI